jgi:hypothetical protein
MNVKETYLRKLKDEKIFIDLYIDSRERSYYGFIADFNDEFLVLKMFNNVSQFDGIVIIKREEVLRFHWGGNDIDNTFKLIYKKDYELEIPHIILESMETILRSIVKHYQYLSVRIQSLEDDFFIGEIEDLDSETLILNAIGTKVSLDRKFVMLNLEEITFVEAGGVYENNLKILFDKKGQV